jgi:hypothetical protein
MNWGQVDEILGRTAATQPDGVHRYAFPRSDLSVTVRGTTVKPGFALGSYAAFKLSGDTAVAMGDFVLTEDEINPVMMALQKAGILTTAVHNHLLFAAPPVIYVHFKAQGSPVAVAGALRTALSLTKTPLAASASNNGTNSLPFDTTSLDSIIGYPGKNNNGVYQYSIARAETIMDGNMVLTAGMGVATVINFQPTEGNNVAITGDFALLAAEAPLVLRTLSEHGIQVTALHSHTLTDSPRLFYLHFWAVGDVMKLGRGLRDTISQTNSLKPSV